MIKRKIAQHLEKESTCGTPLQRALHPRGGTLRGEGEEGMEDGFGVAELNAYDPGMAEDCDKL
ncbi:MAG: hypothetical protein NC355_00300 [Blautia sp.]|nr:hypothetical protein [Blautia sp.]